MKLILALVLLTLVISTDSPVYIKSEACSPVSSSPQSLSPSDVLRAFYEAARMQDIERIKLTLSKGTLEMIEGYAKTQNKTVDESIKSDLSADPDSCEKPEIRNEKIEGDKATIEIKNDKTGEWETVSFVKEDDTWKIALDKMFRDAMTTNRTNPK